MGFNWRHRFSLRRIHDWRRNFFDTVDFNFSERLGLDTGELLEPDQFQQREKCAGTTSERLAAFSNSSANRTLMPRCVMVLRTNSIFSLIGPFVLENFPHIAFALLETL